LLDVLMVALLKADRMTPAEAAEYLGITEATLANWRSVGGGSVAMRVGRCVWYFADDVEANWQEERRKAHALKISVEQTIR
jgi:predicted site-specific integrase-resolvase